jgi:hypothetical protein
MVGVRVAGSTRSSDDVADGRTPGDRCGSGNGREVDRCDGEQIPTRTGAGGGQIAHPTDAAAERRGDRRMPAANRFRSRAK